MLSAQPSQGLLIISTQCFRLQCRLQSSTRTSRSTHRHLLHQPFDLIGNWCQRGRRSFGVLDLGGAHGLLMEIIRFRLPLATLVYLCLAWTLFKTCVWIWTFGLYCVMNYVSLCYSYLFMFILWLWGCANHVKVHIIYILYLVCLDFHL